jgi:surface antigen
VLILLVACLLTACAGGSLLEQAETDASITTGSVSAVRPDADPEKDGDAATIRNAVTSANLQALQGAGIPWANPATGSRGSIESVVEYREGRQLCRRFTASRESFEGVMLYRGDACLNGGAFWWMRSFEAA